MPPIPKPEPRKKTKARQDRYESSVIAESRREIFLRDGGCRFRFNPELGPCRGALQYAHIWLTRAHSRGMDALVRHDVSQGLCCCRSHHDAIDGRELPKLVLKPLTDLKANGPLQAIRTELVHGESVTTVAKVEIPSQIN